MLHTRATQKIVSVNGPTLPASADMCALRGRIVASRDFVVPERVRNFLTYITGETIAARVAIRALLRFASVLAIALLLGPTGSALGEDAIKAPALKSIGTAKREIVPSLIVMNSDGANLTGTTPALDGISPNSIMFSDRPVRSTGRASTAHHLEEWAQGGGFEKDPPNATVSAFDKEASAVEDAVEVLKDPKRSGNKLNFTVEVLESNIEKADGPASVFIDIIGLPRTPRSFSGVARRTAWRGARYAGAAAGAAYGAAPYYRPPYPPPACGYSPSPPCY